VIGAAVVAGVLVAAPMSAQAIPHLQTPASPSTSAEANAKLAALAISNEKLAEQANATQIEIVKDQKAASAATAKAADAQAALRKAQHLLAASVAARYKAASFSRTAAMLASDSGDSYLQTVQTLNLLAERQDALAQAASAASEASAAAEATAREAVSAAIAKRAEISKQQTALNAQVTKYKELLAALTTAERQAYYNANAVPAATVAAVLSTDVPASASKGAAAAIAAAKEQLGKPYVYGAAGPDSFDCSGLTAWAWAAAGVSLPHNAAAQQGMGTAVSQSELQPGDLVFFGSPAYHVALYLGGGMIIQAPTSGDVVKISALASMPDYSGGTRVG